MKFEIRKLLHVSESSDIIRDNFVGDVDLKLT